MHLTHLMACNKLPFFFCSFATKEGKMALQAANSCFVAIDPEDDAVVALRKSVGEAEVCTIRTCAVREVNSDDEIPAEEQGSLAEVEINYV